MSERVVVVGAGPGAVAAARRLRERGPDSLEVVLVAREGRAEHLPGTLAVALGDGAVENFRTTVAIPGVDCRAGEARDAGPDGVTVDGERIAAGAVIAGPGLALSLDLMPDWPSARAAWDLDSARRAAPALEAVPGGRLVIGICGLPYRCPPAPFSLAMQLADRYRRSGRFTKVCVTTPEAFPLAGVGGEAPAFLLEACAGGGVEVERQFELDLEASDDRFLRSADGRELDYELALLVPPHGRAGVLDRAPGDGPLVEVDEHGETALPGLFVVGDAAGAPLPRAAGVARAQGRTAADAVLARLGLADPEPPHEPRASCFISHGGGNTSRIRASYPHGLPPAGEAEVEIDGPTPELALAAEAERRGFLEAAGGSA